MNLIESKIKLYESEKKIETEKEQINLNDQELRNRMWNFGCLL